MKTVVGIFTRYFSLNSYVEKIALAVSVMCSECKAEKEMALYFICSCLTCSEEVTF